MPESLYQNCAAPGQRVDGSSVVTAVMNLMQCREGPSLYGGSS